MQVFPIVTASFDPAVGSSLRLSECNPGDLVFVMDAETPRPHLVVKLANGTNERALVKLSGGRLRIERFEQDEAVAKIQGTMVLDVDLESGQPHDGTGRTTMGAIRISAHGTALAVAVHRGGIDTPYLVDLETMTLTTVRSNPIEFLAWSIRLAEGPAHAKPIVSYRADETDKL